MNKAEEIRMVLFSQTPAVCQAATISVPQQQTVYKALKSLFKVVWE